MDQTPFVLGIKNLVIDYMQDGAARPALRGVDLALRKGEFVAVIGESGSGKSTLVNAALGLLPASARIVGGTISLSGREIVDASEAALSRIRGRSVGLVPQDPGASLNPSLTIFNQMREVFLVRGERLTRAEQIDRVRALLQLVEIDDPDRRMQQYPHELSGGMKQRVLIAIAFGLNPALLVADEPTSALDVSVQAEVMVVFDKLARERGSTILFITHDIALGTDHADRIVVMKDGRIVEDRAVDRLLAGPSHEYTERLIRDSFVAEDAARGAGRPPGETPGEDRLIRFSDVSKEYPTGRHGTVRVLNGVSFAFERGTTLALVGESGAGKSTIAKMLLGVVRPTQGAVSIFGASLAGLGRRGLRQHWKQAQFVFQNPDSALDPRATVRTIVEEPLRAHRMDLYADGVSRARTLIEKVGLDATMLERIPSQLSGGQRQRVAIARALAIGSPILVLDEPLSALDVVTRGQILDLLEELQRDFGLSYLLISHDLATVRRVSDTVVVLRKGEVVEHGPTHQVFAQLRHAYTRRLIDATPGHRLAGAFAAAAATKDNPSNPRQR